MSKRTLPRILQTPAVVLLLVWMLVPLSMTLYFSFIRYVLNSSIRPEWTTPALSNWRGFGNYNYVLNAKDFLVRDPELSVHRLQHPDPDRDSWARDRGIDQPLLPGAGHCAGSADFPVLCHASGQRGVVDQYDP